MVDGAPRGRPTGFLGTLSCPGGFLPPAWRGTAAISESSTHLKKPHSPGFSGKGCHGSAKPSGGEDLDIEEPVACRDSPAFHLHPTLPGMLSPPLIRDQVVQVRQAREKRLLAATWVMKAFHGEQFPLDGVMRLIQERAGHWHPGVCEDRIPARLLVLEPAPDALSI